MTDQQYTNPFDFYAKLMEEWLAAMRIAPDHLTQSILPDWSLIRIDETNSTAPAIEQAILAKQSYGRQLGRMMDALAVLIARQPDADTAEAFTEFTKLKTSIDEIKDKDVLARIDTLANDIEALKLRDADAYDEALTKLRSISG